MSEYYLYSSQSVWYEAKYNTSLGDLRQPRINYPAASATSTVETSPVTQSCSLL